MRRHGSLKNGKTDMIDLLLFIMVAPWVALVSLTGIYLIHDLLKDRKENK